MFKMMIDFMNTHEVETVFSTYRTINGASIHVWCFVVYEAGVPVEYYVNEEGVVLDEYNPERDCDYDTVEELDVADHALDPVTHTLVGLGVEELGYAYRVLGK